MGQLIDFIRDNWGWLSGPVMALLGGASWLINRRVSRQSRKVEATQDAIGLLQTGLAAVNEELGNLRIKFGIRGQAIKEATPDKGKAVFARELELLEEWARKDRE